MFFKLLVLACVASTLADEYGRWVSTSPHRNDPIPPGISPPAQFPAGVDPHSCPNYPHCGNPNTAIGDNGAPGGWNAGGQHNAGQWGGNNGQWNGGTNGQWNGNNGQWNGAQQHGGWNGGNNALNDPTISGSYTGDGDYHGEGLQEAGAYGDISHNVDIWNNGINDGHNNGGWQGGNNGQWNGNNGGWNGGQHQQGAWNAAPQHAQPAQLPAGVSAHQCPNFPFCH